MHATGWASSGRTEEAGPARWRRALLAALTALNNPCVQDVYREWRDDYYGKWEEVPPGKVPFEISPSYMYDRRAPYTMMRVLGDDIPSARLMIFLRHPAARAYSGMFQVRGGARRSVALRFDPLCP